MMETNDGLHFPPKNGNAPPRTVSCQVNSRPARFPGGQILHLLGFDHEWITTSSGVSVGMGTRGNPSSDFVGTPTQVVDHMGQQAISSKTYVNIDPAALDTYTKVGTPTGPWIPIVNDCNSWANGAINNSTPHDITVGMYGVPITTASGVVVYSDGSIHYPGGN